MSSDLSDKKPKRDERIPFSTQLRFEADHRDVVFEGLTTDVSMSGAFIETTEIFEDLQEGDEGVVFVEMNKEGHTFEVSFHCVVARIIPGKGVGFDFESEVDDAEEE